MLLKTQTQYYQAMTALSQKADEIIITTFNIFCGHSFKADLNDKFPSPDRTYLDFLKTKTDVKILVGVGSYYTPAREKGCDDCGIAYAKRTLRMQRYLNEYPNIKWYLLEKLHSKIAVFRTGTTVAAIVGSRNFTNSDNDEIGVVLRPGSSEATELYNYAYELMNDSRSKIVDTDVLIHSVINNAGVEYVEKAIEQ